MMTQDPRPSGALLFVALSAVLVAGVACARSEPAGPETDGSGGGSAGGGGGGAGGTGASGLGGARDAGAGGSAGDPLNDAPVCTSNKMWTGGTDQNMTPGDVCGQCHSNFKVAGTVFPTGHEPDFCDGIDGPSTDVTVVVTDSANHTLTLRPNTVGNFYSAAAMTPPYHAKVVAGGKQRVMVAAQTSGICNACHTQTGASLAPGRITLPF